MFFVIFETTPIKCSYLQLHKYNSIFTALKPMLKLFPLEECFKKKGKIIFCWCFFYFTFFRTTNNFNYIEQLFHISTAFLSFSFPHILLAPPTVRQIHHCLFFWHETSTTIFPYITLTL